MKKFDKLKKENETIRTKISNNIRNGKDVKAKDKLWLLINELIENELQQEEYVNE